MSIFNRSLICMVIAAYLCACATTTPVPVVSEAQRGRMGTVGVVALVESGSQHSDRGRWEGAVQGAAVGALVLLFLDYVACGVAVASANPSSYCANPLELALGGAVLGAVIGGLPSAPVGNRGKTENSVMVTDYLQLLNAAPEDKRGETEARLRAIFEAEAELQGKLRFVVVDTANRAGVHGVTEITAATPTVAGSNVDHRQFLDTKVDTILEVGLVSVSFTGNYGVDPKLMLHADAVARLVDARTNAELYKHSFTYESKPKKASEWNADGARLIKEEIESAYRSLGQSIVNEIFLVVRTN